ncbi:MAG: preprotein translocase subunit SecA [Gordonia sp.]|uniref:DUF5926 family protein n=1 Tax=Gordonia rubripertincta TaxID=36822 RepID=A0ABT4MR10_GORRU|nr:MULTISPECIES: DUF5926 family protein [Mycobacteriales]MBA4025659.1 preprotein translocase subunit SecA [Gordonia sp. (in: high G+C Gram-positive bacteria)]MCZ4549422.1 DUF5926 family protein [Gordonia rubripertincta]OZG28942.1 preprotein translocase subunit SecA [Williamsia sp. 1138]
MAKKSKRGSGPRPGSNRAERVAARKERQAQEIAPVERPFAGVAAECDLVALRSFVASATADLTLVGSSANTVRLVTVLPGAGPALVREENGTSVALVALQTEPEPADPGDALSVAIEWAAGAEAGETLTEVDASEAKALSDILDPKAALDVTVQKDFNWWIEGQADPAPQIVQMIEQANAAIRPTARLVGDFVGAPWWVDAGERAHLRWVRPEDEDDVMAALARVHAAGGLTLGEGSRFAGSFRTHGLLVPVFDLDVEMHHQEWTEGAEKFNAALNEALASDAELTSAERRSRDGIRGRQVTLR